MNSEEWIAQRDVDARIAALSAAAFVKDNDCLGANSAMQIFYNTYATDTACLIPTANALIGALLGVCRDIATSSDEFRVLAAPLVGSDG